MLIKNHIFFKTTLFFLFTNLLFSNISGIVFQDLPVNGSTLNHYGVKDSNELGVQGILVTAYPSGIHTTTDSNGSWSLPTTQNSRIEFSNLPSYLKESPSANINNSSVQFINNGQTDVTFGLHNPADFSNTINPLYVSNIQQNGTHLTSTLQNLQTVHYNANGLNADYQTHVGVQGTGEIPQDTIPMDKLGSVWAKAYQKNKKRLFVASMLQRHVGFANTPADIYITDYSSGTPANFIGHFSLQGKVPSNGGAVIDVGDVTRTAGNPDNELYDNPTKPNIDLDAYAKVGKISYGGMDIEDSTNTLWLINLNQKGIISVDISGDINTLNTATTNQYLIESLPNAPTCSNGDLRPWALKVHEGKGYIGTICDASSSHSENDLSASILSFSLSNPSLGFTTVQNFPLNYTRQIKNWQAWEDNFFDPTPPKTEYGVIYSEPILSDIEFDKNNNMYIAFLDRYAIQLGANNYRAISGTSDFEKAYEYGEILKICNNSGIYEREGTGSCLTSNYSDSNTSEFFNDQGGDRNSEASLGALAILKGTNHLLLTTVDPHPESTTGSNINTYWHTQGTHTLNLTNGSIDNWYSFAYTNGNGLNQKANGLGDIELITDAAPIEIGDRVWLDSNLNGVQDANETTIAGVTVNLVCAGAIVANVTTDSNGNYLFSNDTRGTTTSSQQFNISQLVEKNENNCSIVIPNAEGNSQQNSLNTYQLTSPLQGEGINKILNDSNAQLNGNDAIITIYPNDIPISGSNNHSFDIGFKASANTGTLKLGNYLWTDSNHDGIQDSNESGINGITVNLYNNANCSGASLSSTTTANGGLVPNDGFYQFSNLPIGTYCVEFMLDANQTVSPNSGANDVNNSDANSSGFITNINLVADDLNKDIGVYATSAIGTLKLGNYLWTDSNHDGIQDSNESGINGITVNLYNNVNCSGASLSSTTTANGGLVPNDGFYQFSNLPIGTYCVEFMLDANQTVSPNSGANDVNNSDANSSGFITNINLVADDLNKDIGVYVNSTIIPVPMPVPVPVPNPIPIVNPSPSPTPSLDNNGTLILGNYLWNDSDHDGIQDNNESGINGVTVNLYNSADCSGNILRTTITSNAQFGSTEGFYQFSNLTAGTYCIEFILDTNQTVSPNSEVNGIRDSDANRSGFITNINLVVDDLNEDIGVYTPSNRTVVAGATVTSGDENCSCSDYTESSVSIFNNILTLLFLIISTSILGIFFTQRERLSL